MGNKTKIDWCDATWNPVTGCLHGCEYCYARRIAERFGSVGTEINTENGYECDLYEGTGENHVLEKPAMREWKSGKITKAPYPFCFDPTFHRYKLDEPQKWKKPRNIFVCSMADLFGDWVPDAWIDEVLRACEKAPQHRYLFLTKNTDRMNRMMIGGKLPNAYTERYWFGNTWVPASKHLAWGNGNHNSFVSIEPILEPIINQNDICRISAMRWIIVGAETGNRKGKVVPTREWIEDVMEIARIANRPLFMKESLRELMGADFRQEFPWEEKL